MAWWDDLWLNEAFATWISAKIVDEWHPEWDGQVQRVQGRSGVMGNDALLSARRIRQPIESMHDIHNAFDGITYTKGAAIITMFEGYVGAEKFRAGVRNYLRKHAHGNATGAATSSRRSGAAVGQPEVFAAAFSTFLDQPGFPLVTAELKCEKGRPARLALAQQRYLPLGLDGREVRVTGRAALARPRLRAPPRGAAVRAADRGAGRARADRRQGLPQWVLANAEGAGYYRVEYKGNLLERMLREGGKALTVPERMALIGDVSALVRNGRMPYGEALALVPLLARDDNRHILASTAGLLGGLSDHFVPETLRPHYRRVILATFGARARRLGWEPRADESDETRLLRPGLASMVAEDGEDEALRAQARKLAESG